MEWIGEGHEGGDVAAAGTRLNGIVARGFANALSGDLSPAPLAI